MLTFEKPPLSIAQQITQLKNRGLIIGNLDFCHAALTYIGYYRLSGYMIPFYNFPGENHVFLKDTKFEQIVEHYEFDRQLRLLCLNAIEKIEVAFRAVMSDYMSVYAKDSHWFEKKELFKNTIIRTEFEDGKFGNEVYHSKFMRELREEIGRSPNKKGCLPKEKFLEHYYDKYQHPDLPPSWMVFETLTFGQIVFLFKNLQKSHQKQIAGYFGLHETVLHSWMHSICYLRNLCAHHSRLWNRKMSISPKISSSHKELQNIDENKRFYGFAVIIKVILDNINPENNWVALLTNLINFSPSIKVNQMGFPIDWQKKVQ